MSGAHSLRRGSCSCIATSTSCWTRSASLRVARSRMVSFPPFPAIADTCLSACLSSRSQLLTAMAEVQITTLEEMMQKLWIKQRPLLLLVGTWLA